MANSSVSSFPSAHPVSSPSVKNAGPWTHYKDMWFRLDKTHTGTKPKFAAVIRQNNELVTDKLVIMSKIEKVKKQIDKELVTRGYSLETSMN